MHDFILSTRRNHSRLWGFRTVLEAHEHGYLGPESFLVKFERFLAAAIEEQIDFNFHDISSYRFAQRLVLPFVSFRQLFGLLPNALFLRSELGSKLGAEIFGLKYLANFHISFLVMGIGTTFQPPDRLLHRFTLPNPKPGE